MGYSGALIDLTVCGRRESWEDLPAGWPQLSEHGYRSSGRAIAEWSRAQAGRSDDLGNTTVA
jgi:hypothetical protein